MIVGKVRSIVEEFSKESDWHYVEQVGNYSDTCTENRFIFFKPNDHAYTRNCEIVVEVDSDRFPILQGSGIHIEVYSSELGLRKSISHFSVSWLKKCLRKIYRDLG